MLGCAPLIDLPYEHVGEISDGAFLMRKPCLTICEQLPHISPPGKDVFGGA